MCEHALVYCTESRQEFNVDISGHAMTLLPSGGIKGWSDVITNLGKTEKLKAAWDHAKQHPILGHYMTTSFDEPSLRDIIVFGALAKNGNLMRQHTLVTRACVTSIINLCFGFLHSLVAPLFDKFICQVYPKLFDVTRPPPAIVFRRECVRHKASTVDGETAWSLLFRVRESHLSNVRYLLEAKNDEAAYDAFAPSSGSEWRKAELHMYFDKQSRIFANAKQISVVADPSSHCGQETLVSLFYTWSLQKACVAPIKALPTSVYIDMDEVPMYPNIRELALADKLERKPAYRQLQGVLSQTFDITKLPMSTWRLHAG